MENEFFSEIDSIYISKPSVCLPSKKITNKDILEKVSNNFKGNLAELPKILRGMEKSFRVCGSKYRYTVNEEKTSNALSGEYAAKSAIKCLEENKVSTNEIGAVICGSITKSYLEPCMAAEIASRTGIDNALAFDVSAACAGMLQAIYTAASLIGQNKNLTHVLCCSGEFPLDQIDYEVSSIAELHEKSAGYTLGSASASILVSRTPFNGKTFRLQAFSTFSTNRFWELCIYPLQGMFRANSLALHDLGRKYIPTCVKSHVEKIGWNITELDQFISHQPGNGLISNILYDLLGLSKSQCELNHECYGNTATVSVLLSFKRYIDNNSLKGGEKLILMVPPSGFSVVILSATVI